MSIKVALINIVRESTIIRRFARAAKDLLPKALFRIRGNLTTPQENTVYFNTFGGRSYSDSSKAIYEEMLRDERFQDYHFIWAFNDPSKYDFLAKKDRTQLVKAGSSAEKMALHQAKYWITNFRMLDYQWPRKDQVYLQCWHGIPFKKLGYDLETSENAMNSIPEIRNRYKTDAQRFKYLLASCRYSTEKFASVWNLKATNQMDKLIELGYPRNDALINSSHEDIKAIKEKLGLNQIGNKKIILYAPTWRDNQHQSGLGYVYQSPVDFDSLREELGDDYVILFRAHYLIANKFDFAKYQGFVYNCSDYEDVNDLYLASDVLITDYSSVFFDFANLNRPMLFYMYDMEEYRGKMHEFYFPPEELPGDIVITQDDLVASIKNQDTSKYDKAYAEFNEKFNSLNDGKASKRVIEKVFFDK